LWFCCLFVCLSTCFIILFTQVRKLLGSCNPNVAGTTWRQH
jgi:hypothetical protein